MSFQDIKLNLKIKLDNNKFYQAFVTLPKKNLLITLLITLSIPLTLTLVQQQQTIQQNAANPAKPQIEIQEIVQEDNLPDEIVPYTDPQVAQKEYDLSMENLNSLESQITTTQKPNIVIIMLDDVNPIDGRFFTQNRMPATYNNIISKGINFTNFYGETSLCCPGRVGFLTGQHTQNHGVADLDGTKFNPATTIATELQAKGYFTMLSGKYVNYYTSIPKAKAIPPGWNKFDAIYSQQGKYFDYDWISKKSGPKNTEFTITHYGNSPSDYSTDVITKTAVKRLKEAPINKPIFAYLTPYAIHGPRTVAPRYVNDPRCKYIQPWKSANVWEKDVSDKSDFFKDLRNGDPAKGFSLKRDCEALLAVDDLVKQVKNELQRQNRLKNTIFILTADNGYGFGEHRIPAKTSPFTTHIPLYIAWPDGRGTTPISDNTVLSNIDLASTFCDLAGCVMGPYPNGQLTADGISFLSLIKNQPANFARYSILESQPIKPIGTDGYTRPTWWAIRTTEQHPLGKWHYIEYATGENELYDLSNEPCYLWTPNKGGDPCELNNLIRKDQSPTPESQNIVNQLKAELELLKQQKGFTPPTPTLTITPTSTLTPPNSNSK